MTYPSIFNVDTALTGTNGFKLTNGATGGNFGSSVASAGDVNGDGKLDLIIGANAANKAYVIFGASSFSNTLSTASLTGNNGFTITSSSSNFGESVAGVGDVNGDGYADVMVGASLSNKAYIIFGSSGFSSTLNTSNLIGSNGVTLTSSTNRFGCSVAGAGDVNGDGRPDLIIGTYSYRAYVIFGSINFPSTLDTSALTGANGFTLTSSLFSFGYAVAGAGDINGDGKVDLVLGTDRANSAFVIFGASSFPSVLDTSALNGNNGFTFTSSTYIWLGLGIGGAGDINGDGRSDLIIGAYFNTRTAYVIFGSRSGFPSTLRTSDLNGTNGFSLTSSSGGAFGVSLTSAGDINGDGKYDLIVGAHDINKAYVIFGAATFPNALDTSSLNGANGFRLTSSSSYFGQSVAGTGDINGDGKSDFIVGAGGANKAYVIYAESPATLPLACWTSPFPPVFNVDTLLTGANGFKLTRSTANVHLGQSVASVGDFNGDGLADVIVGSPYDGVNRGKSYVVYGKAGPFANPFNLDAALNGANGFTLTANIIWGQLGYGVGSAGDFNRDGLGDVIIGAPYNSGNYGNVYIVYGKSGVFANPFNVDTALNGANGFKLTNGVAGMTFGWPVKTAGDFNGDGKSDVVVGTWTASSGAAYIIYGSSATFANPFDVNAALTGTNGFKLTTSVVGDSFGNSIASGCDFNGDGKDDIAVGGTGASSNAASYVIYGSSTPFVNPFNVDLAINGVNGFKITTISGGGTIAPSVCGDINGDGIGDMVIGTYVIYGSRVPFANPFNVDLALNGINGFKLTNTVGGNVGGSACGDFNSDGIWDIIVGTYVIYGSRTPFTNPFNVDAVLTSASGFKLSSVAGITSANAAGDFNRDGTSDIIVGSWPASSNTGAAYVIYGQSPAKVTCSNTLSHTLTHTPTHSQSLTQTRSLTQSLSYRTHSPTQTLSRSRAITNSYSDTLPMTGSVTRTWGTQTATNSNGTHAPTESVSRTASLIGTRTTYTGTRTLPSDSRDRTRSDSRDRTRSDSRSLTKTEVAPPPILPPPPPPVLPPPPPPVLPPPPPPVLPPPPPPILPPPPPPVLPPPPPPMLPPPPVSSTPPSSCTSITSITSGGTYFGTSCDNIFDIKTGQPVSIQTQKGGRNLCIISTDTVLASITGFNPSRDVVDLSKTGVPNMYRLPITLGSAIIHLPFNGTFTIQNLNPEDLSSQNFIFASEVPVMEPVDAKPAISSPAVVRPMGAESGPELANESPETWIQEDAPYFAPVTSSGSSESGIIGLSIGLALGVTTLAVVAAVAGVSAWLCIRKLSAGEAGGIGGVGTCAGPLFPPLAGYVGNLDAGNVFTDVGALTLDAAEVFGGVAGDAGLVAAASGAGMTPGFE